MAKNNILYLILYRNCM